MKKPHLPQSILVFAILTNALCFSAVASAGDDSLVAWWSFEKSEKQGVVTDRAGKIEDTLAGVADFVRGVKGTALNFDGYTTRIIRKAENAPAIGDEFTIEAWIALGAYPWNWCPVVGQCKDDEAGYRFAIGPRGEVAIEAAVGGKWRRCSTEGFAVPLRKWTYVVGTFEPERGFALYVNGQPAGRLEAEGKIRYASDAEVLIGTVRQRTKPSNIHREHGTLAAWFSLDGIVDELKIYSRAMNAEQVRAAYEEALPDAEPQLPARVMPAGPAKPGRFGAYYCQLKYYPQWDRLWSVGPDPDVVVRFDTSAVRMVFWRGTRYSPAWVSENGLWMADQSVEAWGVGEEDKEGCFEHMQDRRCRYSHVRVIESTDARAVVHWRYAPVSSHDHLWRVDERTGRACWVDEYYYIYPDTMAVRKVSWKTGTLGHPRQFQESLPFTGPGQLQSDVINEDFAFVGNFKGQSEVLRFIKNPKEKELPEDLTMQIYNLKSKYKPFIIFEPGNDMHYVRDLRLGPRGLDVPGNCNHWPVGQMPCDGRTAQAPDRPTHFLGFPISDPPVHQADGRSWWNGLYGMTDKSIEALAVLGRSWAKAPKFECISDGFLCEGYDVSERAYKLTRKNADGETPLELKLLASEESPVFDPAFVIKGWGDDDAALRINGKPVERGKNFRLGHCYRLDSTDLVVWVKIESTEPVRITLTPQSN